MYLQSQRGAALIEIMITVLVMSVGLLGLGATQMMSLKNGNNANRSYLASVAAYDIAERMRANPETARSGNYNGTVDEPRTEVSCEQSCTAAQLAQMDLYQWSLLLDGSLPGGEGKVEMSGDTATVTITWTEKHTGENLAGSGNGSQEASLVMNVEL
ncbi:type IV pilus modification protein PilV [Microbulbifer litoralis]|uniref:type IV pilus modification protein PilV n=1 Tax=Microbulbifer litoralis TaxID=2933965 RepID=UPI0020284EC1|nr:type IV pilus modification protein PilV [Microbulbifer sp. GX H0434]